MIFAADENGAIGKDGGLPWRQSSDLQYFKKLTLDKTIVMGRKTWESLPGRLPRRRHLVMSRNTIKEVEQTSIDEVLELAKSEEIFIIGGGEIYKLFLPLTNKIYMTLVQAAESEFEADVYILFGDEESQTCRFVFQFGAICKYLERPCLLMNELISQ